MRLSTDKRDHAYRSPAHCSKFRIFLDGQELFNCVTADEEKGFVIRQVINRHPVTRMPVTGRSGLIKGKVEILPKNQTTYVVVEELTNFKPVAAPAE
jgi:hypothetical protein